jgi:hypothetical protein
LTAKKRRSLSFNPGAIIIGIKVLRFGAELIGLFLSTEAVDERPI